VAAVLERSTGRDSYIHGGTTGSGSPWQVSPSFPRRRTPTPALVFLFALFHDSMRLNDAYDPLDGQRGGAGRELRGEAFDLEERR
jgi:hypothetical protein